jgi:hypothetical protein
MTTERSQHSTEPRVYLCRECGHAQTWVAEIAIPQHCGKDMVHLDAMRGDAPVVEVAFETPYDDDDTQHEQHLALLRAPSIEDEDHAEAIAESLRSNRAELISIKQRAQRWLDRKTSMYERRIKFDETRLHDYLVATGKRVVELINATLKFTAVKEKLVIVDEKLALEWAKKQDEWIVDRAIALAIAYRDAAVNAVDVEGAQWNELQEALDLLNEDAAAGAWQFINKPKSSISKMNAHFKATGEIPDGCKIADAHDSFSAKTGDELS